MVGWALTVLVVTAGTAPTHAAEEPGAPSYEIRRVGHVVSTKHGDVFVQVAHPVLSGEIVPGPSVFTYSPYSLLGSPPNYRRNHDADRWVSRGYTRVWADVVGTGNSGGCWDYGGRREKETGHELVEWIARQEWSNDKVGMIGGSYEGTTATATAVTRPPHLTTIVPQAAISRWYGYAYSGGVRYSFNNEALGHQGTDAVTDGGMDTPLMLDSGLAIPPPLDVGGPRWAERVRSTITLCEEVEHTSHGYDDTPDYDRFWIERDYVRDADRISIPVLVSHNWGDWRVKQEEGWNLFEALKNSQQSAMCFGTRWEGHGTVSKCDQLAVRWMDHFLKGKDNGIDRLPRITTQTSDANGPRGWSQTNRISTAPIELIAQETATTSPTDYSWKLLPSDPITGPLSSVAAFPSTNANTEAHANHHARSNHDWFWFETPHLKRDTRIFGEIKVQIYSTINREWITFTPSIVDVDPACHGTIANQHYSQPDCVPQNLVAVTRGFLDTRYRKGLSKQVEVDSGQPTLVNVVAKPQDYVFKKGHYIGLNIQTEIVDWAIPKPFPCTTAECNQVAIDWIAGKTRLILPVVDAPKDPFDLFDFGGHHH